MDAREDFASDIGQDKVHGGEAVGLITLHDERVRCSIWLRFGAAAR